MECMHACCKVVRPTSVLMPYCKTQCEWYSEQTGPPDLTKMRLVRVDRHGCALEVNGLDHGASARRVARSETALIAELIGDVVLEILDAIGVGSGLAHGAALIGGEGEDHFICGWGHAQRWRKKTGDKFGTCVLAAGL